VKACTGIGSLGSLPPGILRVCQGLYRDWKSGISTSWNPQGLSRPVQGLEVWDLYLLEYSGSVKACTGIGSLGSLPPGILRVCQGLYRDWKSGISTSWNPQGLSRPVQGLFYILYMKILVYCDLINCNINTIVCVPIYF